eukprot:7878710-Pyramimonas_sp.AAC.1
MAIIRLIEAGLATPLPNYDADNLTLAEGDEEASHQFANIEYADDALYNFAADNSVFLVKFREFATI